MALHWFWVVLGLDPALPLPTVTRKWLKSLYDEARARIERDGETGPFSHVAAITKLNGAYSEAKRLLVD